MKKSEKEKMESSGDSRVHVCAQAIIDECEMNFDAHADNASSFAKAVADAFDIPIHGQADDIVDQMLQSPWIQLGFNGKRAKQMADQGWFVLAAEKSGDHEPPAAYGHVAVIVSGPLSEENYPSGYWGRLGGIGMKNSTLDAAWDPVSRKRVIYAAMPVNPVN